MKFLSTCLVALLGSASVVLAASDAGRFHQSERSSAQHTVGELARELRKKYYDPAAIPPDYDARVAATKERLGKVRSFTEISMELANLFGEIDARYLRIIPPALIGMPRHDWGWAVVDDQAYVTNVNPDTDAARKGIRVGDRVLQIENQVPTQETADWILYAFLIVAPRATLHVMLQTGNEPPRMIEVTGRVVTTNDEPYYRFYSAPEKAPTMRNNAHRQLRDGVMTWIPFEIDQLSDELDAAQQQLKQARALVLDLRTRTYFSPENAAKLCELLSPDAGEFCTIDRRGKLTTIKTRSGKQVFTGPIVVLTNRFTGGVGEILAERLRARGRALLLGERTAGRVRLRENAWSHDITPGNVMSTFGLQIPTARILVNGNKDLENQGVAPDWQLRPSQQDFANNRDPVLAKAFGLLKAPLTPEAAGKFYSN